MQSPNKFWMTVPMLALAGCGLGGSNRVEPQTPILPAEVAIPDTPLRVGEPYSVGGQRYTPVDQIDYDEVGYASWYGDELAGRPTANGESFNPAWVSAAHRILPMPSYIEVTRLDTGRTILVRVNDRGPGDARRLIDLSAGAAQQLGATEAGTFAVRVRRVNPVEAERLALRSGRAVPARIDTPDSLLVILRERAARLPSPGGAAPLRTVRPPQTPMPPAREADAGGPANVDVAGSGFVVQLGAFSSRPRAEALARRLNAAVVSAGAVYRVRYGPFATEAEAQAALGRARASGHPSGVVVRNR